MIRLLLITVATLTLSIRVVAGTVTILPMSPKEGASITIEYVADAVDANIVAGGKIHAVLYGFVSDAESPRATEVVLEKSGSKWIGKTTLAKGIVYTIVKVGNGLRYDTNRELYWEFLTATDRGTGVVGAHMRAALARYGQLPLPCRMKEDYAGAVEELEQETMLHPSNTAARVNYILVMKNTGQLDEAEATAKLREITTSVMQATSPLDAIALSQAYEVQGRADDAQRVIMDAVSRFPRSIVDEQAALGQLSSAPTIDVFMDKAADHLQAWPNSFARQNLIDAVVKAATQQNALRQLIKFLDRTKGITAMTYHQAVNFIGANDSLRSDAFRLIDAGIEAAKDEGRRPLFVGPSEWQEEQRIATSLLYFVQGAIYRAEQQPVKAIASLEKSMEIGGNETEKNCYDMMIGLYRDQQNSKQAIRIAERALSTGAATQGILDAYRLLLASEGMDSTTIAAKENALRDKGRGVLSARIAREMLNQSPIDGTLVSLDGKPLKLSDWRGKVVIIDYWATWCGPCRQSFPSLQKLYERYKTNKNVVFAVVNVWERVDDRVKTVKEFLSANKNLTFPMFIDKDDSVVAKYGVTGIPTKFYLGKDGRVQFKEVGFTPEEQFLEEATNRIEVLLAQ
ncbi:MAG TPA: redoxin family protein [Candidatus Didemnitutus sp.]|nr:redoxin family protein [Candidatus Didemnitutus sp.]